MSLIEDPLGDLADPTPKARAVGAAGLAVLFGQIAPAASPDRIRVQLAFPRGPGNPRLLTLWVPTRADAVAEILRQLGRHPRELTVEAILAHGERVAIVAGGAVVCVVVAGLTAEDIGLCLTLLLARLAALGAA